MSSVAKVSHLKNFRNANEIWYSHTTVVFGFENSVFLKRSVCWKFAWEQAAVVSANLREHQTRSCSVVTVKEIKSRFILFEELKSCETWNFPQPPTPRARPSPSHGVCCWRRCLPRAAGRVSLPRLLKAQLLLSCSRLCKFHARNLSVRDSLKWVFRTGIQTTEVWFLISLYVIF